MPRITQKFVDKLNEETSAENFESIVDKYELETPVAYEHEKLREHDGIEVWGFSPDGEVLVYDNNSGWYLLTLDQWKNEIEGHLEELGYNDLEIIGTLMVIPALKKYFAPKKATSIKVSGDFKDELSKEKLYEDETFENTMKRIIKERDELRVRVEELKGV